MKNLLFFCLLLAVGCATTEFDDLHPQDNVKSKTQKLRPLDTNSDNVTLNFVFGCHSDHFFMDYSNLPIDCSSAGMDVEWVTDAPVEEGHIWVFSFPKTGDCVPTFTEIQTGTEFIIGDDFTGFETIGVEEFRIVEETDSSIFVGVVLEDEGIEVLCQNVDVQYIGVPLTYSCDC